MRPLPKSFLEWRTAPAAIFLIAMLIVAGGIGIILQNEVTFRSARDRQAMVAAEVLAGSVTAAVDFGDPAASQLAKRSIYAGTRLRF